MKRDFSKFDMSNPIMQQLEVHEELDFQLAQAEALCKVALTDGFKHQDDLVKSDYLGTLSDLISEANNINQEALNKLVKDFEF
jgi:hypothetical protein